MLTLSSCGLSCWRNIIKWLVKRNIIDTNNRAANGLLWMIVTHAFSTSLPLPGHVKIRLQLFKLMISPRFMRIMPFSRWLSPFINLLNNEVSIHLRLGKPFLAWVTINHLGSMVFLLYFLNLNGLGLPLFSLWGRCLGFWKDKCN